MSFRGRNWARIGKKLLQGNGTATRPNVTPLALQLVSTSDSVLGPFSNQGGSQCARFGRPTAAGRPGLCLNYREMIELALLPAAVGEHHAAPQRRGAAMHRAAASNGVVTPAGCDPFDGFVLTIAGGAASPTNRVQFTQMEANFPLFAGLAIAGLDRNPHLGRHAVRSLPRSQSAGLPRLQRHHSALYCHHPDQPATLPDPGGRLQPRCSRQQHARSPAGHGSVLRHQPEQPQPELPLRALRQLPRGRRLSNHSIDLTSRLTMMDFTPEFTTPRDEARAQAVGQATAGDRVSCSKRWSTATPRARIQRNLINPSFALDANGMARPDRRGVLRQRHVQHRRAADRRRHPARRHRCLGLAAVARDADAQEPGRRQRRSRNRIADFRSERRCGLRAELHDGRIVRQHRAGSEDQPRLQRPATRSATARAPGAMVESRSISAGGIRNLARSRADSTRARRCRCWTATSTSSAPSIRRPRLNQQFNAAQGPLMGTFPAVNRVGRHGRRQGAGVAQCRTDRPVLPQRRQADAAAGGQPVRAWRRFPDHQRRRTRTSTSSISTTRCQSVLSSADRDRLTAFLLSLTDERVAREQAPFDRPEIFVPVDGRAPDNSGGRATLLTQSTTTSNCGAAICFRRLLPIGAAGNSARLPAFLNVQRVPTPGVNNDIFDQ